ncbi:transcriptional regulator [Saccharobesus litoralis]|uniref:Transcriptional regulator n=1 Tax=Saccharobesus litoralis TaxID=2172099 RepID=A0A2S0VMF8_9ALTE|nr:helix-turn-helix domain-containing protein [Saccharobesus litoralis]AWB65398.1 transcriptional regulator [Saccharobesus litoralis]
MNSLHTPHQDNTDSITPITTMRDFNANRLTPISEFDAQQVRTLREGLGLSQAVFAEYLNVSTKLIQKWEQGLSSPRGAAVKLLSMAKKKGLKAIK